MNRYKFSALLIALFLLNACSGNATKDGTDEVLVEERNGASTSGVAGEGTDGSDLGAEASVIVGEDGYEGSELNDPSNPLSNRVIYFVKNVLQLMVVMNLHGLKTVELK